MEFDGVDDSVNCGEFTAVDGTSAMTLSAWVKAPTGAQSDSYAIVLYKAPSNYFGIYQNNLANQLTFRLVTSGGTVTINGSVGFFDGDWHHIAATYDGSNMYFYEDGVQISTAAQTGTITGSTDDLYIGSQSGTSNFIAGQIDEVSVWSTGLSSGDVSTLWNSGTPTNLNTALATTPIIWYRMGDSGTFFNSNWELPNQPQLNNWSSHSFHLDGVNDYVDLGTTISALRPTGAFSISLWAQWDSVSGLRGLWTCGTNTGHMIWTNGTSLQFYIYTSGGWVAATSSVTIATGQWYHIGCTWNGSTSTIYVDGSSTGTASPSDITYAATTYHNIGRYISNEFNGQIDEVSFFDTALDASTITSIYNSGEPNNLTLAASYTAGGGTDKSGDLQGYWRMGEGITNWNGTNWQLPDYSKNTLFSQKSFAFDGVNDYVSMGNVLDKDGTEAFSISAWVKYTSGSSIAIVAKNDSGTPSGYSLFSQAVGGINWYPATSAGGYIQVKSTNGVNDGNWHHVLATYDGSGNASGAKIYVDGSLDTTIVTDTATGSSSNSTDLQIGARDGTGLPFNGSIDDVAIFNTDKSASASSIYNSGVPSDLSEESGLEGYWTFDDATFSTNWTVPDASTNSNNGTSANMDEVDLEFNSPTNLNSGLSSGMAIDDKVNNAPDNINQGLSSGMVEGDRDTDVP